MTQTTKIRAKFFPLIISIFFLISAKSYNEKTYGAVPKHRYKSIYISGHYSDGVKHGDSVTVILWKDLFTVDKSRFNPHRTFRTIIKNGNFQIHIDSVNNGSYISISDTNDKWGAPYEFLKLYLAQPGDHILLNISNTPVTKPVMFPGESRDSICLNCTGVTFSGKGADKYNCRYKMDKAVANSIDSYSKLYKKEHEQQVSDLKKSGLPAPVTTLSEKSQNQQKFVSYLEKRPLEILGTYKLRISKDVYQILKANLIGEIQDRFYAKGMAINTRYSSAIDLEDYKKLYKFVYYKNTYNISDATALKSVYYLDFLIRRSQLEANLNNAEILRHLPDSEKAQSRNQLTYHIIKSKFIGLLREKLLLSYLVNHSSSFSDPLTAIQDGLNTIKTKEYFDVLSSIVLGAQVGKKAYNFSLPDSTDKNVTLDRYKGKVVFIDFWFTGCKACADYYSHIVSKVEADNKNNIGVVFISISADANKSAWEKGVYSHLYTSPDVVNLYKATSSPIVKQFSVISFPHPLLIDKNGLIFSNSETELRARGVAGLENEINRALALK